MILDKDAILSKRGDMHREEFEVPELGGSIFIRIMTLKEVEDVRKVQRANTDVLRVYPRLISLACVDENGEQLFSPSDSQAISELPWPALDRIATAILKLNKMTGDTDPKD